jgi:predicted TIM-barrel fold metal-dependent hydrolase
VKLNGDIVDVMVQTYFDAESPELPIPRELLRDAASRAAWPGYGVVSHIYGDSGEREAESTDPGKVIAELDKWGIARAQIPVYPHSTDESIARVAKYSDRFFATLRVNPHEGYSAVRRMDELIRANPWIRSISIMPAILYPPIPPDSREFYPVYTKCIELDIPVMINVGIGGPRTPSAVTNPMLLDHVAWFFPELRIVMKHGGEPWADLCVRLMKKWPNLYFATTAFAPRRYPAPIVDYMTKSRAHKVIYGGYFPSLSLERIMSELAQIDLDDEAANRFLRSNAREVYKL